MALALLAGSAQAQDYVHSEGPLEDTAFYRLVACAAPPNGPCTKPFYRWIKPEITVGITTRSRAFLGGKMKRADASLFRALQHLDSVQMGVQLSPSENSPDITIHLLDTPRGEVITGTQTPLDGLTMANAITVLDIKGSTINAAHIGFSNTLTIRQYESVMLEEITQALGLVTDIENTYYNSRSIFSQSGDNSLKTFGQQDRMALIRHYPPN